MTNIQAALPSRDPEALRPRQPMPHSATPLRPQARGSVSSYSKTGACKVLQEGISRIHLHILHISHALPGQIVVTGGLP